MTAYPYEICLGNLSQKNISASRKSGRLRESCAEPRYLSASRFRVVFLHTNPDRLSDSPLVVMLNRSESALARVSQQLSRLEKRDWELWGIVSLAGILVTVGLLALLVPGAFKSDTIHFEITV